MIPIYKFSEKYWHLISLFLLSIVIITLFLLNASSEIAVSTLSVFLFALASSGYGVLIWKGKINHPFTPWIIAGLTIIFALGIWHQKDPNLLWAGSDVARDSYEIALISIEEGPLTLLNTWNARANPYAPSVRLPYPDEIIHTIETLNIGWIAGDRWDTTDLPQHISHIHLHPPINGILLGAWMSLFGISHLSSLVYMLLIKFLVILLAIYWVWYLIPPTNPLARLGTALLLSSIVTHLRTFIPHPNDLAMLFAVAGVLLLTLKSSKPQPAVYYFSGVLLGLAGYTNFIYIGAAIAIFLALVFTKTEPSRATPIVLFFLGGVSVIVVFFLLGYYPWLTYFTGSHVQKYYKANLNANLWVAIFAHISISIPILIVTAISLFKWKTLQPLQTKAISLATLSALFVNTLIVFPIPPSRYLAGYFFLLTPLLAHTLMNLRLSKTQVAIIPFTNIAYVLFALYLQ